MTPKLKNKSYGWELARNAAKLALGEWYSYGYERANILLPRIQVHENLKDVAVRPGWQQQKGYKNGYVMLTSLLNGELTPMIVVLDYTFWSQGGLTYRSLHKHVREFLGLEPQCSLRIRPFRPWCLHMQKSHPVPESRALPDTDAQCRHLLGTTLLYYTSAHLD